MKLMIDMFGGLGGASEAFLDDKEWIVWRIDNNQLLEDVPNMQITDDMFGLLRHYNAIENKQIELVWASPPCREFSHGFNSPVSKMRRGEEGFENFIPSTEILENTIDTIQILKPKFWVIENVVGAIKWFKPFLGEPTQIIGSQVLWGNFPFIHMPPKFKANKSNNDSWPGDPLRANKKAVIPYQLSMRLKITITEQRQLTEWI